MLRQEKQRLLGEMQKKADQLKKEQKKRDQLAEMIKKMEGKLLAGGKNIADRADEAKRAHEKMRQETIEHKVSSCNGLPSLSFISLSLSLSAS